MDTSDDVSSKNLKRTTYSHLKKNLDKLLHDIDFLLGYMCGK